VTHRGIVSAIVPMARPADTASTLTAAQLKRMRNPFNAFQLDATAYPGNSGSPVYEPETGRVVGVLNSVYVQESRETILQRPSGISYAIPVVHILPLLGG
jgi:serine protease Do